MKAVWAAPIGPPTAKLVLLALADWASDDGGSLHPSLQSIADKVGVSRSQAQRIVRGFIDEGLLSVVANRFGGAPGCTPQYRLHLDRLGALATDSVSATPGGRTHAAPTDSADATPTGSIHATGSVGATGSTDAQDGSHGCGGRVAPMRQTGSTGATQTIIEPSKNHQRERAQARPTVGLRTWLETVKASGEKAIPDDDAVFGYADEVGIPSDFLQLAWREFRHRYCQPDAKRYKDWRAVFRKAVRENWLRLWYLDGQSYALTTAGMQAQRVTQERAA